MKPSSPSPLGRWMEVRSPKCAADKSQGRTRFGRLLKNLSQLPIVCTRALLWLFWSPNPRRFANVRITHKAGGIRACLSRAFETFSDINRTFKPRVNELTLAQSAHILSLCPQKPLISLLAPLNADASPRLLKRCVASLGCQHYENWQLILLSQDTENPDVIRQLVRSSGLDEKRVDISPVASEMTLGAILNEGLKVTRGRFVGFLDPQDELAVDALTWLIRAVNSHPDAAWFYSDQDRITNGGKCHSPNFKPDFSAEFLLSNLFTDRLSVYAAETISQAGGFTDDAHVDPHYDLALRLSEMLASESIIHIPRVLYHKRGSRISTHSHGHLQTLCEAGRKAVMLALKRRKIRGSVTPHRLRSTLYQIAIVPNQFPKVTVVIPTRNSLDVMKRCLDSLRDHTKYPDYDILVVDNQSNDPSFLEYIRKEQSDNRVRVINYDKPFNHSDINNTAVRSVDSDFIVFMNNDIKILSDGWLEQLVGTAQLDDSIANVGVLLLYPDKTVQHAGIILGILGTAGHAHKYMKTNSAGYHGRLYALQEFSAVTAAFSLVRVSAFKAVGGFNAERYPTSYNDVDLCIRFRRGGYRCIYNPMVRAIHFESRTRPITTEEFVFRGRIAEDYPQALQSDPFYNPNLTLKNEQFAAFRPFPVELQIPELHDHSQYLMDRI